MTESRSAALQERLQEFLHQEAGPYRGWDPVNRAMIRHWCDAMGDSNPLYTDAKWAASAGLQGIIAPPAMLQAWVMPGFEGRSGPGSSKQNPFAVLEMLEEAGYPAIVAVNCEQEYFQYLQEGDELSFTSSIEEISEEKQTALGSGFFVTQLSRFYRRESELAGTMLFRVFKYRPKQLPAPAGGEQLAAPKRFRPVRSQDTAFFWEGAENGQLLLQRCRSCSALRHPPAPMCPQCQSLDWDTLPSSGQGILYSYAVFHRPAIPPFDYPNLIGLVELEEGTRLISQLAGMKRDELRIGMPLEVFFETVEEGLTLPMFRPRQSES